GLVVEEGGTIISVGACTSLARHLGLAITSHLVLDGKPLARTQFYVPGSVLSARVDTTRPVAWGMPERVDVFFEESPVFDLAPDTSRVRLRPVAWFDSDRPLRSGWAWGQQYLKDGVAVGEAPVGGKGGKPLRFGPATLTRA